MSYNGYGPSLADQGYSASDLEDLERDKAEAWWRNQNQTGWALPAGKAYDYRVSFHLWSNGGTSACGKWEAPVGGFEAFPVSGQQCSVCERHEAKFPDRYAIPSALKGTHD